MSYTPEKHGILFDVRLFLAILVVFSGILFLHHWNAGYSCCSEGSRCWGQQCLTCCCHGNMAVKRYLFLSLSIMENIELFSISQRLGYYCLCFSMCMYICKCCHQFLVTDYCILSTNCMLPLVYRWSWNGWQNIVCMDERVSA